MVEGGPNDGNAIPEDYTVAQAFELFRQSATPWDDHLKQGEKPSPEIIRNFYGMATFVLRTYCHPNNWPDLDGPPNEQIPLIFAHFFANQFAYIATGVLPEPMRDAVAGNRPAAGPHELKDIGHAVAYIVAARKGFIDDPSPIKTIAKEFKVQLRTVKRWQRKFEWVKPTDFHPFEEDEARGRLLERDMKAAAERYRVAGRSTAAVLGRSRKRKPKQGGVTPSR